MEYKVFFDDVEIARYNVIDKDHVEYKTIKKGFEELKKRGQEVLPMLSKDFTAKNFPFLDNRIRDSKRFDGVRIRYSGDPYELVEIKED